MSAESPKTPSAETALAVLGVKLDAMKVEASAMNLAINAKLDGVHLLVSEKVSNIEKRVTGIEEDVDTHTARITKLETDRAKLTGGAAVVGVATGGVLAVLGEWIANHLSLFK